MTSTAYPRHPDLKGDPMRQTLSLLRRNGLKGIAYIPLNHGFMETGATNPHYENWKRRHCDGRPIVTGHYRFATFNEGCINSPLRDVILEMNREVLSYDFDVMYFGFRNISVRRVTTAWRRSGASHGFPSS